ncbi:MAG: caspase family protein [Caldilineaceae bacterium]
MQPPIFALLVGINHYASPSIPDLGGCVNDVRRAVYKVTLVPATQIKMLLDQQATYDAVKSTFRQHLIDDLRAFIERQQANPEPTNTALPAVLFHFSGHGSQARDESGQEPDGLDETLVCHDSRLPGVFDLKDWELGRLLDEVAQYTDNITVILDCCHSGSGTRHDKESHDKEIITHIRSCDRTSVHSQLNDLC